MWILADTRCVFRALTVVKALLKRKAPGGRLHLLSVINLDADMTQSLAKISKTTMRLPVQKRGVMNKLSAMQEGLFRG